MRLLDRFRTWLGNTIIDNGEFEADIGRRILETINYGTPKYPLYSYYGTKTNPYDVWAERSTHKWRIEMNTYEEEHAREKAWARGECLVDKTGCCHCIFCDPGRPLKRRKARQYAPDESGTCHCYDCDPAQEEKDSWQAVRDTMKEMGLMTSPWCDGAEEPAIPEITAGPVFWMVYGYGQRGPVVTHDTYSSAFDEAKRLALKEHKEFAVLEAVTLVRPLQEVEVLDFGEPEGAFDEIPY